jgi:hypothetical protein
MPQLGESTNILRICAGVKYCRSFIGENSHINSIEVSIVMSNGIGANWIRAEVVNPSDTSKMRSIAWSKGKGGGKAAWRMAFPGAESVISKPRTLKSKIKTIKEVNFFLTSALPKNQMINITKPKTAI